MWYLVGFFYIDIIYRMVKMFFNVNLEIYLKKIFLFIYVFWYGVWCKFLFVIFEFLKVIFKFLVKYLILLSVENDINMYNCCSIL